MPNQWGVSPLGNLSEFPVPQFHTGEGLAAILALRQRQMEQTQKSLTDAGETIGGIMQQRKRDELANAMADQAGQYYGIDVPRGDGLGSGELRLKTMRSIFEAKQSGEEAPLEQDLLRARIKRQNALASGGDGGDVDVNVWTDPETGRRYARGSRGGLHPLTPQGGGKADTKTADIERGHQALLDRKAAADDAVRALTAPRTQTDAQGNVIANWETEAPSPEDITAAKAEQAAAAKDLNSFRGKNLGILTRPKTGGADTNLAPDYGQKKDSLPHPKTPEEAAKLPSGSSFIGPDGKLHTVP